ncbi:MAG: hypothetical protein D6819_02385 [Gammaproteobacteria bacterium]|nr:MAG: hypothetical protein D6819_02385 [Gammaproteobacteria bacterium]
MEIALNVEDGRFGFLPGRVLSPHAMVIHRNEHGIEVVFHTPQPGIVPALIGLMRAKQGYAIVGNEEH